MSGGSAAACSALVVLIAARTGLWLREVLTETIYWFLATGAISVANAVASPNDPDLFRKVRRRTFRFTVLLEFFVTAASVVRVESRT